jgi:ribosome-binding factor A
MESTRQHKIARLIQKDLGLIFQQYGRDHFPGTMITVTKVYITRDLSVAKIYLSLFTPASKPELLGKIRQHVKELRRHLGERIKHQVRFVPELLLFEDDSLDYIDNIDHLLHDDPGSK